MAEQTQLQQVTMKDPKKVEQGKRLAEYNRRKREELSQLKSKSKQVEPKLTYYGARAIAAIRTLGVFGYYIYQLKKTPTETLVNQTNEAKVHQPRKLQPINLKWIML